MKMMKISALVVLAAAGLAHAGAVRGGQFNSGTLARNDDLSTGFVSFGFAGDLNFFGQSYNGGFVNNNGNLTFDAPLSTFTPFNIITTGRPMLAPFFADVDTRNAGSAEVTYGTGTVGSNAAFGVNWVDVGYFANQVIPTNSFQLVIIDRSDTGAGNFDFEFNYDRILWETGSASGGGAGGLGGNSARSGWSNGTTESFEFTGSAVNGALLDNGPNALIAGSRLSNVAGRYVFEVRNGVVGAVPLPTAAGLGLAGMGLLAGLRRRR